MWQPKGNKEDKWQMLSMEKYQGKQWCKTWLHCIEHFQQSCHTWLNNKVAFFTVSLEIFLSYFNFLFKYHCKIIWKLWMHNSNEINLTHLPHAISQNYVETPSSWEAIKLQSSQRPVPELVSGSTYSWLSALLLASSVSFDKLLIPFVLQFLDTWLWILIVPIQDRLSPWSCNLHMAVL